MARDIEYGAVTGPPAPTLRATLVPAFAGASAAFCGNGLARFAYVPMFPAMVSANWVTGAEAGLLGAINLAGYLVGVLGGRALASRFGTPGALNLGMGLTVVSLGACTWHAGVPWLGAWRGVAGIAGGILMALAGPAVQGAVPADRRGLAGSLVLGGVAAGIVAASIGVPALLLAGISEAWLGLALLAGALWALVGRTWPRERIVLAATPPLGARSLYAAYALSAAAFVPHMVYFADLVVRGRSNSPADGALAWLLFGIGGLVGSLVGGSVVDRRGAVWALRAWLVMQVASLVLVFLPGRGALFAAALLGGFAAISLSAATLARARDLAGPAAGAVWVRATAAFAIAQAITGFALAALFARTGSHDLIFGTGLVLALASLVPAFTPVPPLRDVAP